MCPRNTFPFITCGGMEELVLGKIMTCICGHSSAGCWIIIFLLLVSDPLVGETDLEVCAGFLLGGADAWWLELSSGPMGRVMLRSVSRDGCGIRNFLGSLTFDGWGCAYGLSALESTGFGVGPGLGAKIVASRRAHVNEYSLVPLEPVSLLSQPQLSLASP